MKKDYRILAIHEYTGKVLEFVCYLTKKELEYQIDGLIRTGYKSIVAFKLNRS